VTVTVTVTEPKRRTHRHSDRPRLHPALAAVLAAVALTGTGVAAQAHLVPGTPRDDVHLGPDRDNAGNTFIQPPGTSAKLDMSDTDVLFGRNGDDLLTGRLGSDTLVGGRGSDILIGGPDGVGFPRNDVLLGDQGSDVATYSPGDGNDAYVGDKGFDAMILGVLALDTNGDPELTRHHGRSIPHVDVAGQPRLSCDLVVPPTSEHLGAQFLVRLQVDGSPVGSVRLKDVERLVCPSSDPGSAEVADLTEADPRLRTVALQDLHGAVGAVVR
jgi:hypothetical protein